MGTVRKTVKTGDKPTKKQRDEIKKASFNPIAYDEECPQLTPEQLEEMAKNARAKREELKKEVVALRIHPETLKKAKATGKGYTGFLSRLLDVAINDPEIVKRCL